MAINKVVLGTETLIDLTDTTATAADVAQGAWFYTAAGVRTAGTSQGGAEGSVYQDQDGFLVVDDGESSAPQGTLSITANGTYDVADYAGADVDIPVGMTETELKAYIERSSSFTDIEWPDGMINVGSYAFAGCTKFNPSSLPSTVTTINSYAFYNCQSLSLTSLPSNLSSIQDYAFYGCVNLSLTSIPANVTNIANSCYYGCTKLALASLPSGVKYINSYAFHRCVNLAITTLPGSVTKIYSNAFRSCTGISSISCEGAITTLDTAAFIGDTNGYLMALTSASFPNMALTSSLGTVFGYTTAACACQLLEFCDIGSTTGIGSNAFANCYSLETLVLRKTASVCSLANVSAFLNTPMRGYDNKTGTVYVPEALITSYQTATNWSTLYNAGTVTFEAIEGSEYERD